MFVFVFYHENTSNTISDFNTFKRGIRFVNCNLEKITPSPDTRLFFGESHGVETARGMRVMRVRTRHAHLRQRHRHATSMYL